MFADEAQDGFIVFTLGSFVSVSSMPQDLVDTFMRVFSKLPQRVIWKWEANIPAKIPPNVMMVDWIPQQDLLGITLIASSKITISFHDVIKNILRTSECPGVYHSRWDAWYARIDLPWCSITRFPIWQRPAS